MEFEVTTETTQAPRTRADLIAPRRKAREVKLGDLVIGGDNPIRVQTMTSTDTADVEATAAQIEGLAEAGAEIMRVTVDTRKAAKALPEVRRRCPLPLVCDIHYNHRLALDSAVDGSELVRIGEDSDGAAVLRIVGCQRIQRIGSSPRSFRSAAAACRP